MKYLSLEERIREVLEMWRFPVPIHDEDGRLNKVGMFLLDRIVEEVRAFDRIDKPKAGRFIRYFEKKWNKITDDKEELNW